MQDANLTRLNRILAREASSLLHYLEGAWPWSTDPATLDRLRALQTEQTALIQKLANFLLKRRLAPAPSNYPEEFTTLHFVGLDHLLPRLVSYERWLLEHNETDATGISEPEQNLLATQVLEMNRTHLAELEQLNAAQAGGKAASTVR